MTEKNRQMNDEELDPVAGGSEGLEGLAPPFSAEPLYSKTFPHCKGCGSVLPLFSASYICDHVGCPELGKQHAQTEVDWY